MEGQLKLKKKHNAKLANLKAFLGVIFTCAVEFFLFFREKLHQICNKKLNAGCFVLGKYTFYFGSLKTRICFLNYKVLEYVRLETT